MSNPTEARSMSAPAVPVPDRQAIERVAVIALQALADRLADHWPDVAAAIRDATIYHRPRGHGWPSELSLHLGAFPYTVAERARHARHATALEGGR